MSPLRSAWIAVAGLLAILCLFPGCRPVQNCSNLCQRLQDDNPRVRIDAIVQAGRQRDRSAIPLLVDRLADPDADVRMFAILSLEKITSQTLDYRYYAPSADRQAAIERWRSWLTGQSAAAEQQAQGG